MGPGHTQEPIYLISALAIPCLADMQSSHSAIPSVIGEITQKPTFIVAAAQSTLIKFKIRVRVRGDKNDKKLPLRDLDVRCQASEICPPDSNICFVSVDCTIVCLHQSSALAF